MISPKLDAKFTGAIFKVKDGSFVPDDEYVVFLAKDNAFANVLPMYLEECKRLGADAEQLASIKRMMQRVNDWRYIHEARCKVPDAAGEKLLA